MPAQALPAARGLIDRVWRGRWALPIVTVRRSYRPDGVGSEGIPLRDMWELEKPL
jgi:hypothetical protein